MKNLTNDIEKWAQYNLNDINNFFMGFDKKYNLIRRTIVHMLDNRITTPPYSFSLIFDNQYMYLSSDKINAIVLIFYKGMLVDAVCISFLYYSDKCIATSIGVDWYIKNLNDEYNLNEDISDKIFDNSSRLFKYFEDTQEYPDISGELLPFGITYEYISSSFLDGLINYYTPIKAFAYNDDEDDVNWNSSLQKIRDSSAEARIRKQDMTPEQVSEKYHGIFKKESGGWNVYSFDTREDVFKVLTETLQVHSKLYQWHCDVIILGQNRYDKDEYCVFWYDRDVSDCLIGRFKTKDGLQKVKREFGRWIKITTNNHLYSVREIPKGALCGWISWS